MVVNKVHVLVVEHQSPYGKNVLGVYDSASHAEVARQALEADNDTPYARYDVEEVSYFA